MPCVIEWSARIKQPAITEMPVGVVDIFPPLVEVMQAKISNQVQPLDGISLLPIIDGQMKERPKPLGFWQSNSGDHPTLNGGPAGWSDNRYKLVKTPKRFELYDLTTDLAEKRNIAGASDLHPRLPLDDVEQSARSRSHPHQDSRLWFGDRWKHHRAGHRLSCAARIAGSRQTDRSSRGLH